jgi:hypothetical protein
MDQQVGPVNGLRILGTMPEHEPREYDYDVGTALSFPSCYAHMTRVATAEDFDGTGHIQAGLEKLRKEGRWHMPSAFPRGVQQIEVEMPRRSCLERMVNCVVQGPWPKNASYQKNLQDNPYGSTQYDRDEEEDESFAVRFYTTTAAHAPEKVFSQANELKCNPQDGNPQDEGLDRAIDTFGYLKRHTTGYLEREQGAMLSSYQFIFQHSGNCAASFDVHTDNEADITSVLYLGVFGGMHLKLTFFSIIPGRRRFSNRTYVHDAPNKRCKFR